VVGNDGPTHQGRSDPPRFPGLLFEDTEANFDGGEYLSFASELNLDQVVASMVAGREEPEHLTALFYRQLHDPDQVRYRQEVFVDLETPRFLLSLERFSSQMGEVRAHLRQLEKMSEHFQREAWHLDAAAIYCDAVRSLAHALVSAHPMSRGLAAFSTYLEAYVASAAFTSLTSETAARKQALARVRYCTRIRGSRVDVTRYGGENDYSAEVTNVFERFRQGVTRDYRIAYRTSPGINHVTAQILERVARLFPEEFSALDEYCRRNADFVDQGVRRFEREVQFYLAYLDYIRPLRSAGLPFCYPDVSASSKEVFARDAFDLPLSTKLVQESAEVVLNTFELHGPERIFVVTGPNQGGKTTFARTFGQLHHIASLGCPAPGTAARVFLFDRLFTVFQREEDLARMTGKLEDDIRRVKDTLRSATTQSILILNEVFASTTLHDASFLGTKLLKKVIELDMLCVYVTFVDELASLSPSVVSMMSTIVPEDAARRTYKVVRRPADGLAYALAIAGKYNVTYEDLRKRFVS
jgi:DNA mismatch repair protein MutS